MYHSFCCSLQLYIDATEVLKGQEKLEKTSFVPRFDRCSCLPAEKIISQRDFILGPSPVCQSFCPPPSPVGFKDKLFPWKRGTICPLAKELSVN